MYGKIENNILIQKQVTDEKGFIKIPNDAVCGQIYKNGILENPPIKDDKTYAEKRIAKYPPIGDQLDAILKWVTSERFQGEDLPADLDAIIGQWTAVKRKYPKPKGEEK